MTSENMMFMSVTEAVYHLERSDGSIKKILRLSTYACTTFPEEILPLKLSK